MTALGYLGYGHEVSRHPHYTLKPLEDRSIVRLPMNFYLDCTIKDLWQTVRRLK
jgi:hypothetical protein